MRSARTQKPVGRDLVSALRGTEQGLFLGATSSFVKTFSGKPGRDIVCRKYLKLVPISRGCPYRCAYFYLDLVYRRRLLWIKMNLNYDRMLGELRSVLAGAVGPISFNMGEMLDSLTLDHVAALTPKLVPFFAGQPNG